MEYSELFKQRHSVRKFSSQPVEEELVAAILEAGRRAPTAANKQPFRLMVLKGAESMKKLAECTPYTFEAPMAIVVCSKNDEAWVRPFDNQNAAMIDAAIVGTHIMLAVHDIGLGSTWVGHFDPAKFRATFQFDQSLEPVAIFPIGHPAPDAKPASMHEKRRPLNETVVTVG